MDDSRFRPFYPLVDAGVITALRTPLWLLFGGVLLVVFDITAETGSGWTNTASGEGGYSGFRLDFLHDAIGYSLCLLAMGRLRRLGTPSSTKRLIPAVTVTFAIGIFVSVAGMITGWQHGALGLLLSLFGLIELLALLAVLWMIASICEAAKESRLARHWRNAILAVVLGWGLPVAVLWIVAGARLLSGAGPLDMSVSSPATGCAALLFLLLPLVWLGIAFFRTSGWVMPARLHHCHVCGYDVVDLQELRCPECGTRFTTERGSAEPGASTFSV